MSKSVISIVAALPDEVRHLCRRHELKRQSGTGSHWYGTVAGQLVDVRCTGVGAHSARAGFERLLRSDSPAAVIFVGTAGALSPALGIGDLLVADRVISSEDPAGVVWVPESVWLDRSVALTKAHVGTVLTAPRIVHTAAGKQELVERHALDQELAAVDMESHIWAGQAAEAGLPFVVLRSMSDSLGEDLPIDLNDALRSDGSLSRARVMGAAIRQPAAVPALLGLRDRVKSCSRVLEQALVSVLG